MNLDALKSKLSPEALKQAATAGQQQATMGVKQRADETLKGPDNCPNLKPSGEGGSGLAQRYGTPPHRAPKRGRSL